MRFILMGLGWLCVLLGVIGIILPMLPTTPFILLAAALFSRSSPRFERWLISHPLFGKPLNDWRRNGAIGRRAKILAVTMMAFSYAALWFVGAHILWVRLLVAAILISCAAFVVTRPEPN
ncbi:YbaN family protein [Rhizobium halophytocola]|uniref:Uncharacterized membrane protein YbaN (DUF454 family) n=1 Tax=Rhizobium halophytocola TaxID=735519 RepID=A0ABS4DTR2_9HYPH|nr:YbaN family protein [Rhizobium halophytocola]MBP1849078.1 uncharacterized membrane protein YbaN (DUF454 family) [Rhizobium halophytocola]